MKCILGTGKSSQAVVDHLRKRGEPFRHIEKIDAPVELTDIDLLVKAPGILMSNAWVVGAQERGINVVTEIDLALRELAGEKRLIGVTGSNGKTTTVMAIAHVLGDRGLACGNIGIPLLSVIDHPAEVFVVELSSFQLETLDVKPLFDAVAILNITPNHLDHHPTMEAYIRAKEALAHAVVPGGLVLRQKDIEEFCRTEYKRGEGSLHDRENFAAAAALLEHIGISLGEFEQKISSFKKPPHRIEHIDTIGGVEYINDSKATSVDAVKKAVASLRKPVILIAGGVDKGGAFSEWIPTFRGRVKRLIAIGQAAPRIERELAQEIQVSRQDTLEEALQLAAGEAKVGECVLLSPGCASFDAFENFEHRGEVFREFVKRRKL